MNAVRQRLAKLLLLCSIAFVLFSFVIGMASHTRFFKEWPEGGFDFRMRMNEISCLIQGVDPYKVWTEEVALPPYYRFLITDGSLLAQRGLSKPLNAYPPWEYAFMCPFKLVPEKFQGIFYKMILLGALVALFCMAWRVGCREGIGCVLAAGFSMLLPYYILSDILQGNFAVLITVSLACMMLSISHRHDWIASLCLAFAMVKPQMSMLFVIPLLMQGKFRVVAGAAVICLLASIPPSLMCGSSVVTLILEAPKASIHAFGGCNLFPQMFLSLFDVSAERMIFVPLVIGVALCAWLSWRLKGDPSPVVRFAPAALCSLGWTYTQTQNYVLQWFVLLAVLVAARRVWPKRWPVVCFAALVLCQWPIKVLAGILMYFSGIFRGYQLPSEASIFVDGCWAIVTYVFWVVVLWRFRMPSHQNGALPR